MQRDLDVELKDLLNKTENLIKTNIMSSDMIGKLQGFKRDILSHYYRGRTTIEQMDNLIDIFYDLKFKRF